uniref:Uncharacterized protein n=1 Tax=Leersia perrieri TaxID=77586 RepID=A0A0D9VVU3_9ORYZ
MSKSRGLLELMAAVDAGLVSVDDNDSAHKFTGHRRGRHGGRQRVREPAPPPASLTEDDASFEFSAAVSYSSSSPASMVFSDGQLRAHQFPAVRSSSTNAAAGSQVVAKAGISKKKRVSFKNGDDGTAGQTTASKAGEQQRAKGGGLLGCMGSTCGSSRNEVVEPGKMNANRKVIVAVA